MRSFRIIRDGIEFIRHLLNNRYLIYELTKRDFRQKYVSNVLGLAWSVLDPLALMLIFWLIFGLGFKGGSRMEIPYVTYLITGLAAYLFFQTTLIQATASIAEYHFLVSKVKFRVSILPLVKILSELTLHVIVVGVAVVILLLNGIYPRWSWFQLLYYIAATMMLLLGLSWFSSAVRLFFPDIQNIIQIFLRFFFYLTPIFWTADIMPEKYLMILKLNPMYYIVVGYRDSLIFGKPFWERPELTVYFWALTLVCLFIGIRVFSRLKPHFADVV